MTGLELLEPRVLKDKVNIESIEQKFAIKIPTAFKVFIESFQLKDDLVRDKTFYYYPELRGGEITFPLKSLEDILRSTLGTSDDEVLNRKLILFANNRYGIYIGTTGEDADKVFTKTNSSEGFIIIANNVFEFLRGVTDNLSNAADTEDEYRSYMIALGYEDEDLEQEIADWKTYKSNN